MSIRKVRDNVYRVEIDIIIDGQRHRPSRQIETTLKGKQLKALQYTTEAELEEDLRVRLGDKDKLLDFTLRDLYMWYIDKEDIEVRTKEYYTQYMENRTIDYFKNKKAIKVTYTDAEAYMQYLDKVVSGTTKKPLSQKTKKHYLTVLHSLFETYKIALHRQGYDKAINPFYGLSVKSVPRQVKGKYYSPAQIKHHIDLLTSSGDTELSLMYILTVLGGLRPSELRGLWWDCWDSTDPERQLMYVCRTYTKTHKSGSILKGTKNNVERSFLLIPLAVTLLTAHYQSEKLKRRRLKITKPMEKDFIFTNAEGKPLSDSYYRTRWARFCDEHDLEYKPPYALRHSTATLLAYKKVPKISIGSHLGHLDPQTTDIYIHAVEDAEDEIQNILEETLAPKKGLFIVGD